MDPIQILTLTYLVGIFLGAIIGGIYLGAARYTSLKAFDIALGSVIWPIQVLFTSIIVFLFCCAAIGEHIGKWVGRKRRNE